MAKTTDRVNIAIIATQIMDIKDDLHEIKGKLDDEYITRQEFEPVKKIVYGMVGLILFTVTGWLLLLLHK